MGEVVKFATYFRKIFLQKTVFGTSLVKYVEIGDVSLPLPHRHSGGRLKWGEVREVMPR